MDENKKEEIKSVDKDNEIRKEASETVIYSILNFFEVTALTIGWLCIKLYYFIEEKPYKESWKKFIDDFKKKKNKM